MYIYIYICIYICIYMYNCMLMLESNHLKSRILVRRSAIPACFRKGGCNGWKPPSSSIFSIRAFRAQICRFELFELVLLLKLDKQFPVERFEASRAIRGSGISVSSTLPPLNDKSTSSNHSSTSNDNEATRTTTTTTNNTRDDYHNDT